MILWTAFVWAHVVHVGCCSIEFFPHLHLVGIFVTCNGGGNVLTFDVKIELGFAHRTRLYGVLVCFTYSLYILLPAEASNFTV